MRGFRFRFPVGAAVAAFMLALVVGWPWLRVQAGWAARPVAQVTRAERVNDTFVLAYDVRNEGRDGVVEVRAVFAPPGRTPRERVTITRIAAGATYQRTEVFTDFGAVTDPAALHHEVTAKAVWRFLSW